MDVTVYKQEFIFPMPIGLAFTKFELTGRNSFPSVILDICYSHFKFL